MNDEGLIKVEKADVPVIDVLKASSVVRYNSF